MTGSRRVCTATGRWLRSPTAVRPLGRPRTARLAGCPGRPG
ncbi:hypothetical protein [Pilimelia anulata]|nr:hypothetical protein [Pilimelia anulata]